MPRFYIVVRSDMSPGLQVAQSVHAAIQFLADWPQSSRWVRHYNLVVVAVPDELALADIAAAAVEEGICRSIFREPDLDNTITAVALQPSEEAQKLCARLPLALREMAMT